MRATTFTEMRNHAILFTGIQATGKSSFYRERFFHTHVRINLDMLRTRHRERVLLRARLEALQPFVVAEAGRLALILFDLRHMAGGGVVVRR